MNRTSIWALLFLTAAVTGCASQVPHAERFPPSSQLMPKASKHWETMADDIAWQSKSSLERLTDKPSPVYVAREREQTAFSRAFREFIVTRLVQHGVPVSQRQQGAVRLEYQTQLVQHRSERNVYYPGTITALTGGLLVGRDIVRHGISPLGFAAAGIGADVAASLIDGTQPTKLELIVTSSIVMDGRYLMRKSDVYYLDEADAALFMPPRHTPVRQYRVVGGAGR